MYHQVLISMLVSLGLLISAREGSAKELLFKTEPANDDYRGADKKLGEAYRTEFNPRMFPHRTWHQRLSYSSYKPDVDETVEIYSKPDGSRWLSHRRAIPSLSGLILRRVVYGEKFDLKKRLDAVRISSQEVALPAEVAKEIELLWETMLPGVANPPEPRILVMTCPDIRRMGARGPFGGDGSYSHGGVRHPGLSSVRRCYHRLTAGVRPRR